MIILFQALIPFESISYTKRFLSSCYEKHRFPQAQTLSYHTSFSFIYHLQQGRLYFEQASNAPIHIQPMLLFYGTVQLLKACVLTADPFYPENSAILAHGVTTRKRKKQGYRFLDDEIKIQKNGLFLHSLQKMFHVEHHQTEKYKMNLLFKQIAEMHPLFATIYNQEISLPVSYRSQSFSVSSVLLDDLHMTANRFGLFLEQHEKKPGHWFNQQIGVQANKHSLTIPLTVKPRLYQSSPWLTSKEGEQRILRKRDEMCTLPELSVHYLLLYNLSMICRYEAEWWGELHHTFDGDDLPFIKQYLFIAKDKLPFLFEYYLGSLV